MAPSVIFYPSASPLPATTHHPSFLPFYLLIDFLTSILFIFSILMCPPFLFASIPFCHYFFTWAYSFFPSPFHHLSSTLIWVQHTKILGHTYCILPISGGLHAGYTMHKKMRFFLPSEILHIIVVSCVIIYSRLAFLHIIFS